MNVSFRNQLLSLGILLFMVLGATAQSTWRKSFGFGGNDEGLDVHETSDGGYIAAGSTGVSWQGSNAIYVVKLDGLGNPVWTRTFGSTGVEKAIACAEVVDGYAIAGYSNGTNANDYDLVLLKLDFNGNEQWRKTYGSANWDFCNSFAALADGYILGGITYGPGATIGNSYLVRTDLTGDTLWTRTLNSPNRTEINKVVQTMDLGFLASGKEETAANGDDASVWKLDAAGNTTWQSLFGGADDDEFTTVMETSNGSELVAAGHSFSFTGESRMYLQGLDNAGIGSWTQDYSDGSGIADIVETNYGWYAVSGFGTSALNESDMIFTILSPGGWFQYGNNYGTNNPAAGASIDTTSAGGYVIAGWIETVGPGPKAMYIVRVDSAGNSASATIDAYSDVTLGIDDLNTQEFTLEANLIGSENSLRVLGTSTKFNYFIVDALGRILDQGISSSDISVSGLSAGQYYLRLTQDGHISVLPFIIQF